MPEYLVNCKVIAKKYHDEIRIYAKNELVCEHKRIFGNGNMQVDIRHYLNTLLKKPGAVRNSVVLKSIPKLKAIFDTYYSRQPKKFIEIFLKNKDLEISELVELFEKSNQKREPQAIDVIGFGSRAEVAARAGMAKYGELVNVGVAKWEM